MDVIQEATIEAAAAAWGDKPLDILVITAGVGPNPVDAGKIITVPYLPTCRLYPILRVRTRTPIPPHSRIYKDYC